MPKIKPQRIYLTGESKLKRALWIAVSNIFFRPSPRFLYGWRRSLLRLFGARIGKSVWVYPSARIWAPWNLEMESFSTLGEAVDCYCVAKIHIGERATVSQYSYLCTATHDYNDVCILHQAQMPLLAAPIFVGKSAWITSSVFVGPGVTVGEGAVVLARSTVIEDVPPWLVVAGNPAIVIKQRVLGKPFLT